MEDDDLSRHNYASTLLQLSRELGDKDLKEIRFYLEEGGNFGAREVADADALGLITLLRKYGKISKEEGNSYLDHILVQVGRNDLSKKYFDGGQLLLNEFAARINQPYNLLGVASQFAPVALGNPGPASNPSSLASGSCGNDDVAFAGVGSSYSGQADSSYQNLVSSVQSFLPAPDDGDRVAQSEARPSRGAITSHRIADLKNVDEVGDGDNLGDEETRAKEVRPLESLASTGFGSAATESLASASAASSSTSESLCSSRTSESVAVDGASRLTVGAGRGKPIFSPGATKAVLDGEMEPSASQGAAAIDPNGDPHVVECDGALEMELAKAAVASVESDDPLDVSAIQLALENVRPRDYQVFQELPLTAGTSQIDHPRILAQIGMNCEMRGYQRTLAEPGLKGDNNIIVLQTGGGKTHVAAYVTKYHYEKAKFQDKKFLALFLVPIRHLADQQGNIFEGIREVSRDALASLDIGIAKNTGEFKEYVRSKEVIFCTAQILVNIMRDKIFEIDMRNFSIIVIDECHHTVGGHPNNRVMEQYFKLKMEEESMRESQAPSNLYRVNPTSNRPQIIGLTASLGAGKAAKSHTEDRKALAIAALTHLSDMCSNLDASTVVFPFADRDIANLRDHCPDPASEEIVPVGRRYDQDFYRVLHAFVSDMLDGMRNPINVRNVIFGEKEAFQTFKEYTTKDDARADDEEYIAGNYLMEFNKAFAKLKILRCLDVTEFLETNENLPFHSDARDIHVSFVEKTKTLWNKYAEKLKTLAATVDETALPIMDELKAKLLSQLRDESDRGIVLVKERFTTVALLRFVMDDGELSKLKDGVPSVRPTRLVGQEEMSDTDQAESLRKFRSGECNLLIATDIAQEGLDIPECNFVVRYHFVSNEIGTMQAVGRARKEGSRCYLLVLRESPEESQEKKVQRQIRAMKDALNQYNKKCNEGTWLARIAKRQKEVYEQRKKRRDVKLKMLTVAEKYNIVCGQCKSLVTPAERIIKIRETNHHLLTGDEIEDVVLRKELADEKNDHGDEVERLNAIYCSKCKTHKLGVEFVFKRAMFFSGPQITIKAENVKYVEKSRPNVLLPKGKFKWKDAPFNVKMESYSFEMNPDFSDDDDDFDF